MNSSSALSMQDLRRKALAARRELDNYARAKASTTICNKVVHSSLFRAANRIACYLPMRDEVDTRIIIERAWRAKKRIFVPITGRRHKMFFREIRPDSTLRKNSMSIWEPNSGLFITARELQLVITPTVAFDDFNHRIGMGGGYYDRCFSFLKHRNHWLKPKLLGVAFDCQKIATITANTWDIPLYRVISESS